MCSLLHRGNKRSFIHSLEYVVMTSLTAIKGISGKEMKGKLSTCIVLYQVGFLKFMCSLQGNDLGYAMAKQLQIQMGIKGFRPTFTQ